MKQKKRSLEIFSLSFLDIISCGFGAVVLLVLISKQQPDPAQDTAGPVKEFLSQVLSTETTVESLKKQLATEQSRRAESTRLLQRLQMQNRTTESALNATAQTIEQQQARISGLELVQSSLSRSAISQATAKTRDEEVGGIPVDSDYVVFIVDTSGSMQEIWDRVVTEVVNVLTIHPQIKGFQILNDNGAHIVSAYEGRWIPDTPSRRKNVIDLFRTWKSVSNSSPVEGLEVALRRYAKPNIKLSIYIFGDEYSGSSYDPVINALVNLNTNRVTGAKLAKVHAVGFISNYSTGRFGTLMREVTRRNNGTFLALPK